MLLDAVNDELEGVCPRWAATEAAESEIGGNGLKGRVIVLLRRDALQIFLLRVF